MARAAYVEPVYVEEFWLMAYLPGSDECRLYRFETGTESAVDWKIASLQWEGLVCRRPNWLDDELEARYSAYVWGAANGQHFTRVNVYE